MGKKILERQVQQEMGGTRIILNKRKRKKGNLAPSQL